MPITSSAKKALRGSLKKKLTNDRRKKALKDAERKIGKLVAEGKNVDAGKLLSLAYQAIDKAMKRGVIKKNKAARKKAHLARIVR